ncbi:hypothetical protein SODALDRAFT_204233 [Sodiomyces alkalinus F11]|uniref:C2H2-type domain-containing protein n=1 Tax=Sodiomyces alkalinus (strain CBS 110278 / VKM F-3762 / F11) TaxID=1314773 RepID=A0A3N2PT76_SODAK|nr:hypothetical protein SODALDRAFT_204233 [Sodiomyces alkalinus F11]ROT37725.1 hypothetical protein SODALDRAFT_204233 [Sodiomyces alkalinus F11]
MDFYFKSCNRPPSAMEPPGVQRPPSNNFDAPVHNWPPAYNLFNFYQAPPDADPWVPKGVIPERHHGREKPGAIASREAGPSLSGWRSAAPSECDTMPLVPAPSDSGYETRESLSLFEGMDRSQDTQSITGQMVDYHPFAGLSSDSLSRDMNMNLHANSWPHPAGSAGLDCQSVAPRNELICLVCRKTVKTKSQLAKHHQRHSKPHKCDVPGCPRQEGFSTLNDLDRHKRSLHPDLATAGPRYRCHLDQCQNKDKLWPRADNFRSHLKRVHAIVLSPDEDLIGFVVPSASCTPIVLPLNQSNLEGVGSAMESSYLESTTLLNPTLSLDPRSQNLAMSHVSSQEAGPWADSQPPQLAPTVTVSDISRPVYVNQDKPQSVSGPVSELPDMALCASFGSSPPRAPGTGYVVSARAAECYTSSQYGGEGDGITSGHMFISEPKEKENVETTEGDDESQDDDSQHQSPAGSNQCDPVDQENSGSAVFERCTTLSNPAPPATTRRAGTETPSEMDMDDRALWALLQKVPKRLLEKFVQESGAHPVRDSPASTAPAKASLPTCSTCHKTFARQCELRKHQRRHDKPYGCTFPNCHKKFGSKNDWKRHENSQHYQHEVWGCNEQSATSPDTRCGKVFPRRALLRQHLQTSHCAAAGGPLAEKELDECRVDQNGEPRFWCGFCSQMVDTNQQGLHSWAERFNHIDDHISGRNDLAKKTMAEWKSIEPDMDALDVALLSPPLMRPVERSYGDATPVQAEEELPQSYPKTPGKRKPHDDEGAEEFQPKRTRREGNLMWTCVSSQPQPHYWGSDSCLHWGINSAIARWNTTRNSTLFACLRTDASIDGAVTVPWSKSSTGTDSRGTFLRMDDMTLGNVKGLA